MPCYDERSSPAYVAREFKERLDKATRVACTLLTKMHPRDIRELPKEIQEWWGDHQELDRQREMREQEARERKRKKKAALAKLSPEERKVLGI
jgi:hypothetical protein